MVVKFLGKNDPHHDTICRTHPIRLRLYVIHIFLILWKIKTNLAHKLTSVRQCAFDMHGTTSRSWLVKGQEVHVHCVRGFSCA
jgi:hypothetical protein